MRQCNSFLKGFSLIEALLVVVIIGLLVAIPMAFMNTDYPNQKKCTENIDMIQKGIEGYYKVNSQYPPDDSSTALKTALYPAYVADADVFVCPNDTSTDSYSQFYVRPNSASQMEDFVLGCPRHENNTRAINLFFQGQIFKYKMAEVTRGGGGSQLTPGDIVRGEIDFADGGRADVKDRDTLLMQSFYTTNNRCYTVLKDSGYIGGLGNQRIECIVIPGSKFQVVGDSGVVTTNGAEFQLLWDTGSNYVTAKSGMAVVSEKTGQGDYRVFDRKVAELALGQRPKRKKSTELAPEVRARINTFLAPDEINDADD